MNASIIITAINNIANKMYTTRKPFENATNLLTSDEAALVRLTDVNIDQEAWKVINGITEWVNAHAA